MDVLYSHSPTCVSFNLRSSKAFRRFSLSSLSHRQFFCSSNTFRTPVLGFVASCPSFVSPGNESSFRDCNCITSGFTPFQVTLQCLWGCLRWPPSHLTAVDEFLAGRLCQAQRGHLSHRDGCLCGSSADARWNFLPPKLGDGKEHRDGRSFCTSCCASSRVVPSRKHDLVHSTKLRKTSPALLAHPWRSGKCHCYASSSSYHDSWSACFFKKMSGPYIGVSQKPDTAKTRRSRAYYKSEEYDISEIRLEGLTTPETSGEIVLAKDSTSEESLPWWQDFPKRWVIVLLCFMAFLLCNMDRVNMSIAVLPMSQEFGWNSATVGLIQSSFFWGYLLTQIVGGIWADKIGGKLVLGFGVVWWSIATVLTPIAARLGLPFLLVMRAFMGIGEGVAMPAMNNILSKWIPVSERSRSLALVYSGMYLGSVTGLAFSPVLIHKFGWPSVFYAFGSLGSIWFALWQQKAHSSPKEDPELSDSEKKIIMDGSISKEPVTVIPWKLILSKPPVWALIISHFCHNWGTFILLTWMPTYYNQVLKFNLTESGLLCVLPWLTMAIFANIGGWIADTLVSRGLSVTSVRKIMQSIGFLGPAFFLTQLSNVKTPALAVLCMACSQGSDAFSQSGLYSNHQDIGPRYAGVLLGLSNTAGVLAGVFGTAATGYILQRGSWDDVFKVAVALYIIGTLVWNFFATGEKVLD